MGLLFLICCRLVRASPPDELLPIGPLRLLGGLVDVVVDAMRDQLLLDPTLTDHFQRRYRRRVLIRGSPSPLLPAIDLDQLVDDALGDHDELERLMWLLNG